MSRAGGRVIVLLGAESTGKTTLAHALCSQLCEAGHDAVVVPEYLREFCDRARRTPRIDEQTGIAEEQTRRIARAANDHGIVIADTSALMTAVYSDLVFGDTGLYAAAEATHVQHCDLTLLTALDLPWEADGLQRDGPQVRAPVDARIRAALDRANAAYAVVWGTGAARTEAALASIRQALAEPVDAGRDGARWHWHCERCGDADCEARRVSG